MARPPKQDPGDSFRIQLRSEWRELLDALVDDGEGGSAADLARDFIKKGLLETFGVKTIREAIELSNMRKDAAEAAFRDAEKILSRRKASRADEDIPDE